MTTSANPGMKKNLLGCFGAFATIPFAGILNGWVVSILWGWFVGPQFHLPSVGIAEAGGISLVISMLTYQDTPRDKDREWWEPLARMFMKPFFGLLFGCIWKAFL